MAGLGVPIRLFRGRSNVFDRLPERARECGRRHEALEQRMLLSVSPGLYSGDELLEKSPGLSASIVSNGSAMTAFLPEGISRAQLAAQLAPGTLGAGPVVQWATHRMSYPLAPNQAVSPM